MRALGHPAARCCALALGGCGNTLQDQPIAHNTLESLIVAPYPVYWLGRSFQGLQITEATHDPGGAFTVQYGNCLQGGQGTLRAAAAVVTSPDNSFLAGGSSPQRRAPIRGVPAVFAQRGHDDRDRDGRRRRRHLCRQRQARRGRGADDRADQRARRARRAAAARLPDTGFGSTPLPSQMPSPLRALD